MPLPFTEAPLPTPPAKYDPAKPPKWEEKTPDGGTILWIYDDKFGSPAWRPDRYIKKGIET